MSVFQLRVEPEMLRRASLVWMVVLEIYWIALVLVAKPAPSAASIQVLTLVIGLAVAVAAWRAGAALADGLRVLDTLRAPSALWHAWLRKVAVTLATRWTMAVVAGTVAVMQHGSGWMWSGPAALYSAVLIIALLASIAQHGRWHWAWTWVIAAALAIAVALARWQGLSAWMEGAPAGHLALAFVCVGATVAALAGWRAPPLAAQGARGTTSSHPLRRLLSYARRFTMLYPPGTSTEYRNGRGHPVVLVAAPLAYMLFSRTLQKTRWGDPVGVSFLFGLLMMMAFVQSSVVCKDLHWRRLLAPKGFTRGRVGWHLIRSTLEANLLVAVVFAVIAAALMACLRWTGMQIDAVAMARAALPYSVAGLDYLMAICVAVAMRTLRGQMIIYVAAVVLTSSAVLWVLERIGINPFGNCFVIGPAYLACVLAITVTAAMLANRLWTMERLLPYMAPRDAHDKELTARGRWFPWPGRSY